MTNVVLLFVALDLKYFNLCFQKYLSTFFCKLNCHIVGAAIFWTEMPELEVRTETSNPKLIYLKSNCWFEEMGISPYIGQIIKDSVPKIFTPLSVWFA